jgi:uncharacterized protein YqeY
MSVEFKLKDLIKQARLAKSTMLPFLQFVLSEIQKIGKNKGNRDTTEDEAVSVVKKMIENSKSNAEANKSIAHEVEKEINILTSILPAMVDTDTIAQLVDNYVGTTDTPSKGELMKMLKSKYGSLIDLKLAGSFFDARIR